MFLVILFATLILNKSVDRVAISLNGKSDGQIERETKEDYVQDESMEWI